MKRRTLIQTLAGASTGLVASHYWQPARATDPITLTLVGYALARPAYSLIIPAFVRAWKTQTGQDVRFIESYGAAGAQTRAVSAGLEADIMIQVLETFITPLVAEGLVAADWQRRLPHNASPKTSVMAIITRPDSPKAIQDWPDLAKLGVEIVAVNPLNSGNARMGILVAYFAIKQTAGEAAAAAYLRSYTQNIISLAGNAREASDIFVQNGVGDALITFEAELINIDSIYPDEYSVMVPNTNIVAEFPVTVIDAVVDRRGTREVAEAFLNFLYSPVAQHIYALAGYRPTDTQVLSLNTQYQPLDALTTIAELGGWPSLNQTFFDDDGLFDQALAAAQR